MKPYLISVYVCEYYGPDGGTENNLAVQTTVFCAADVHAEKMAEALAAGLNAQGVPYPVNCERAHYWATWEAV